MKNVSDFLCLFHSSASRPSAVAAETCCQMRLDQSVNIKYKARRPELANRKASLLACVSDWRLGEPVSDTDESVDRGDDSVLWLIGGGGKCLFFARRLNFIDAAKTVNSAPLVVFMLRGSGLDS